MGFEVQPAIPHRKSLQSVLAMKILVVDDHPLFNIGLTTALIHAAQAAAGMAALQVQSATTLQQGLQLAASFAPDIVLLDYHLPHSSGLEALQAFADQFPWIARVVISGDERAELAVQARAHGASGLISKALPIEEVLLAIQTIAAGAEWWAEPQTISLTYAESAWPSLPAALDDLHTGTDAMDQAEPAFTLRQLQVLRLLGSGLNNRGIADQLLISERTVKQHISDMMAKSRVTNRVQLLNRVRDKGLV
jgi:DNA-binding NarL/FixJ family response regulator